MDLQNFSEFTDKPPWISTSNNNNNNNINNNNNNNRSDANPGIWYPEGAYAVRGACLALFGAAGILLNIFIIVSIVPNRRLRTVRNILLVHLGLVGLVSSAGLTMFSAVVIFEKMWVGGAVACHVYGFALSVFTFVSAWTIAALSWDKYRTIASPLRHSLTASFGKMTVCFTVFWIGAFSLSLPPLFGANQFVFHGDMAMCTLNFRAVRGMWYSALFVSSAFLVPFALMTYCYSHIFKIARSQSSRIAASMVRMVSVIQAPITPAPPTVLSIKGTKALSTILQLMGAFALTYIPFCVVLILETTQRGPVNELTVVVTATVFQAAPMTNAAVYGVRNKILRASFYRYLRRKIQGACYRDKRRGSVRSVTKRSSSALRLSTLHRRCGEANLSRNPPGLRRTQSFPAKALPQANGLSVGLAQTVTGPYSLSLNEANSLTPVD